MRTLLTWPERPAAADTRDGLALVAAASRGREGITRLLLTWGNHPPRADCLGGEALIMAAGAF